MIYGLCILLSINYAVHWGLLRDIKCAKTRRILNDCSHNYCCEAAHLNILYNFNHNYITKSIPLLNLGFLITFHHLDIHFCMHNLFLLTYILKFLFFLFLKTFFTKECVFQPIEFNMIDSTLVMSREIASWLRLTMAHQSCTIFFTKIALIMLCHRNAFLNISKLFSLIRYVDWTAPNSTKKMNINLFSFLSFLCLYLVRSIQRSQLSNSLMIVAFLRTKPAINNLCRFVPAISRPVLL